MRLPPHLRNRSSLLRAFDGPGIVVGSRGWRCEPKQCLRALQRLAEEDWLLEGALDDVGSATI